MAHEPTPGWTHIQSRNSRPMNQDGSGRLQVWAVMPRFRTESAVFSRRTCGLAAEGRPVRGRTERTRPRSVVFFSQNRETGGLWQSVNAAQSVAG